MANAKQRRNARLLALQALYGWQFTHAAIATIIAEYHDLPEMADADRVYFDELASGVCEHLSMIESYIKRYLDRALSEVDIVELTLLRMATYELLKRLDVPYRVVLNEALELQKSFGATEGFKFVNGILDKIAREIRHREISKK